jgi:hypothetical protein
MLTPSIETHSSADKFTAANQKSRYDAEVIADLDRHLQSLARVLEPISKMDASEISPDLGTDVKALIE